VVLEDDECPLPPGPLSEQRVASIFAALPRATVVDLRNRLHLELLYSCALRNHEAVSLDVGDVDLDAHTLYVRITKSGVPRALPWSRVSWWLPVNTWRCGANCCAARIMERCC